MTRILTPGQRHEATVCERRRAQGAVRRPGRGRPRLRPGRPGRVVGDTGDSGRRDRTYWRRRGIRYTIPKLRTAQRTGPFDRTVYRRRHHVERLSGRCTQYRRLATRYDKRAPHYRALGLLAFTLLSIKRLH